MDQGFISELLSDKTHSNGELKSRMDKLISTTEKDHEEMAQFFRPMEPDEIHRIIQLGMSATAGSMALLCSEDEAVLHLVKTFPLTVRRIVSAALAAGYWSYHREFTKLATASPHQTQ